MIIRYEKSFLKKLISKVLTAVLIVSASCFSTVTADSEAILECNGNNRIKSGYTLTAKLPDGTTDGITGVEFKYFDKDSFVAVSDDVDTSDNEYIITNAMANKTMCAYITTESGGFTTNSVVVSENLTHVPTAPDFVELTPDEYKFIINLDGTVSGELALLDYDEENGRSLVMKMPAGQIDTTPFYENDADDKTQRAILDISDPRSIIYKMNTEENLEKYSLPSVMHEYILTSAWETEAGKPTMDKEVSNMQNDTVFFAKIAPISGNEYNRYSNRMGINDVSPTRGILFRSTSVTSGKTELICGTQIWTKGKTTSTNTYDGYYTWRSVFWVDNSIFENSKLINAGSEVVNEVLGTYSIPELLQIGYTEEELSAYGFNTAYPTAQCLYVKGMNSVSSCVEAEWKYMHTEDVECMDAKYQWYRVDSNGNKTEIAGADSKKYTVSPNDAGYRLSFSVIPIDANSNRGEKTYSPESDEISDTALAVKYENIKIQDDGTASLSYTLERLNDAGYKAMLWTYSQGSLLDYDEEIISTASPCTLSTAKTGAGIYAVSALVEADTNIPVFILSDGDENANVLPDTDVEGFSVVADTVKESYVFYAKSENINAGDIYYLFVEDKSGTSVLNAVTVAESGKAALEFKFPAGSKPGEYYAIKVFNSAKDSINPIEVFYTTNTEKIAIIKDKLSPINPVDFGEELTKDDNNNMKILQISDKYVLNMNKDELTSVGEYLKDKTYDEENFKQFYENLTNAAALYMLANANGKELEVVNYYSDIYKFEQTALYKEYEKSGNKEKVLALFGGRSIKNVEAAKNMFCENVLIEMINSAPSYGKIMNYIDDYTTYFPFDLSEYNNSDREKTALYLLNNSGSYKTMTEIERDISAAVSQQSKSPSGNGNGGGGGRATSSMQISSYENPAVNHQSFADVAKSHWAEKYISDLKEKAIISGDQNGNFNPESKILREEFVKMLVIALGYSAQSSECIFGDVAQDHWSKDYIIAAYENNLISGMDDGQFGIGQYMTRQDMALIISRSKGLNNTDINAFTDDKAISDYAKNAVYSLASKGIINGFEDGSFRPLESATRAQTAKMIYQLVTNY